jgi:hypothetical protein
LYNQWASLNKMLSPSSLRKFALTAALLGTALAAMAQTVDWNRTYSRSDPGVTLAQFVKKDPDGNLIMGGVWGTETNDQEVIFARKYTSSGVVIWTCIYEVADEIEQLSAMDVDGNGNVYLCGATQSDWYGRRWMVVKMDAGGTVAWARNPVLGDATALSVTPTGDVAVTGVTSSKNQGKDMYLVKYSTSGSVIFTGRSNGSKSADDAGVSVSQDTAGNTYVLASCLQTGDNKDMRTIKYSPTGTKLWQKSFVGPTGTAESHKIIAWPAGGCYVLGRIWDGVSANSGDLTLCRYDANGETLWRKGFKGSSGLDDVPFGMAIDATGNCAVIGWTYHDQTGADIMTLKYSPTGVLLWGRRYSNNHDAIESPSDVEIAPNGSVYVVGDTYTPGPDFTSGLMTALVLKYDTYGTKQWAYRYNGAGSETDILYSLTVDSSSRAIVCGATNPSGGAHAALMIKLH